MVGGPLLKSVIIYTLPIIFTGILQLLFNAADLVVVGRFRGSVCVAAVGSTGALINLIINMFIGLSVGAQMGSILLLVITASFTISLIRRLFSE